MNANNYCKFMSLTMGAHEVKVHSDVTVHTPPVTLTIGALLSVALVFVGTASPEWVGAVHEDSVGKVISVEIVRPAVVHAELDVVAYRTLYSAALTAYSTGLVPRVVTVEPAGIEISGIHSVSSEQSAFLPVAVETQNSGNPDIAQQLQSSHTVNATRIDQIGYDSLSD